MAKPAIPSSQQVIRYPNRKFWNKEELEIMRTLIDAGRTRYDVSRVLRRSVSAVTKKAESLGWSFKHINEDIDYALYEKLLSGNHDEELEI